MEWEVRIIEWLQAHLGSFGELVKLLALLVRCGRYAVIMFLIMGVYPKVFPKFEQIGK